MSTLLEFKHFSLIGKDISLSLDFTIKSGKHFGFFIQDQTKSTDAIFDLLKNGHSLIQEKSWKIQGSLFFKDQDVLKKKDSYLQSVKNNISFLESNALKTLNPLITVEQHLQNIIRQISHPNFSEKEQIKKILDKVQLKEEVLKFYPSLLSGGMQQKLAIAIALLKAPELIIAYELTLGLDSISQKEIMDLMKDLEKESTLFLITSQLPLITNLCSHMTLFEANMNTKVIDTKEIKASIKSEVAQKSLLIYDAYNIRRPFPQMPSHSTDKPLMSFQDVSYSYIEKESIIHRPFSLDVHKNKTLGLIGKSGSGKTTIGKLAVGLLQPSTGQILWKGHDLKTLDSQQQILFHQKVQIIFQNPLEVLNPSLTILEILKEPFDLFPVDDEDPISFIYYYLDALFLDFSLLKLKPTDITLNDLQKISIIRSLFLKPELLICDEIFSYLSYRETQKVLNLFFYIQGLRNMTLIMINHDLLLVEQLCDHIAIMENGQIIENNSYNEIFKNPQKDYTKKLIQSKILL